MELLGLDKDIFLETVSHNRLFFVTNNKAKNDKGRIFEILVLPCLCKTRLTRDVSETHMLCTIEP